MDVEEDSSDVTTEFFGYVTVNLTPEVVNVVFDLSKATIEKNDGSGRPLLPLAPIGTLSHEATHAFLIESNDAKPALEAAEQYYANPPLKNGGTMNDPERAVQEAAATYVKHRVVSLLHAHNALSIAETALKAGDDFGNEMGVKGTYRRRKSLQIKHKKGEAWI